MTGTPDSYLSQCVADFMADNQTARELERHFQTCPDCNKLFPDHCEVAAKIIEQSIETKSK